MIRVVIAARSAVARAGLEALLRSRPNIEVAGSAPDPGALAPLVEELQPDVVVAEVPDDEALPDLALGGPSLVLLSDEPRPEWIREALRSGVRAVLPRQANEDEILAAVEAAAAGLVVLQPQALEPVLGAAAPLDRGAPAGASEPLTPREIEVLRMLGEGYGNKTVAWKLEISEHTVKFHVASIMSKLHAGSRTEAVAIGIRRGLLML